MCLQSPDKMLTLSFLILPLSFCMFGNSFNTHIFYESVIHNRSFFKMTSLTCVFK